jgi:putative mRNA 3-end processing factor
LTFTDQYLQKKPEGLYFAPGNFYLDPVRPVGNAVISHGHADHTCAASANVWCTKPTSEFMKVRFREKLQSSFNIYAYQESFEINGCQLMFYPAGHILGSAMIHITYNGLSYCYTGDFKIRKDPTCEEFKSFKCDVLVTESTFADPDYIHPDESNELEKFLEYGECNIVIGAYNLGKAQRLTRLFSLKFPERRIMIHPEAVPYHKVYEEAGIKLGNWEPYNYQLFNRTKSNCLIVPPRALSTYKYLNRCVSAFATGWKDSPFRATIKLNISDHADWNELMQLIELSRPEKIITVHGDGTLLKKYFKEKFSLNNIVHSTA